MRVTNYTDYTLKVLLFLAEHDRQLVTVQDIATAYDISKNHLMKVVHQLALQGLVHSARGRAGGVRLGVAPEQINLGSVVRATEPDFTVVECFDPAKNECRIAPECTLKGVLYSATLAYVGELDKLTLADVMREAKRLQCTRVPKARRAAKAAR